MLEPRRERQIVNVLLAYTALECSWSIVMGLEIGDPSFERLTVVGLGQLMEAAVSPAGGRFMTISGCGLQIWSMKGDLISRAMAGVWIIHAEWSQEGDRIAVLLQNGSYRILSKDGEILVRSGPERGLPKGYFIRWAGGRAMVVVLDTNDQTKFRVWDLEAAQMVAEVKTPDRIWDIVWSHNSSLAAVRIADQNELYIYDAQSWTVVRRIPVGEWVLGACWSRNDAMLAYLPFEPSPGRGKIRIWDARQGREVARRDGISGFVQYLEWSPDGRFLAASCVDQVRIYNGTTLEPIFSIDHPPQLIAASWDADSSRMLTASEDGSVRIWDTQARTGSVLWQDNTAIARVRSAPSGSTAFGLSNGEVMLIDGRTGGSIVLHMGGGGGVCDLDWASNSRQLVVGYESGLVAVWLDTGELERSWTAHSGKVRDVELSPSGEAIATVGDDGYLAFWDMSGRPIGRMMIKSQQASSVSSLAWSPNGSMIATGPKDGTVQIWSYPGLDQVASPRRYGPFTCLSWAPPVAQPNLDLLAGAGLPDDSIVVWDASGMKSYYETLRLHSQEVTDLAWSPDGSMLATCSLDGDVRIWDVVKRGVADWTWIGGLVETVGTDLHLTSVDWKPDSTSIVASSKEGILLGWNLTARLVLEMENHSRWITGLSWSPDADEVAFTTRSRELEIYNVQQDTAHRVSVSGMSRTASIVCMDWCPDGSKIAVGCSDKRVRVIGLDGKQLLELLHRGNYLTCLEWSPNSEYLASASDDQTVKIWDGHTGSLLAELSGHTGAVQSLSWSPDSGRLASCSYDGEVRIWTTRTGQSTGFRLSQGAASAIAWSPDGGCIAVSASDQAGWGLYVVSPEAELVWNRRLERTVRDIGWSPDGSQLAFGQFSVSGTMVMSVVMIVSRWGVPLCNLTGHQQLDIVEWSPNGVYLATGGYDGILTIYDARPIGEMRERPFVLVLVVASLAIPALKLRGICGAWLARSAAEGEMAEGVCLA